MSFGGRIELAPTHVNKFTILHEMAHEAGYGGHGRGFRLMQVLLLAKFGDLSIARKLHRAYVAKGLPVALSDIPPVTPWPTWVNNQIAAWYKSWKRNNIYVDGKWTDADAALAKLANMDIPKSITNMDKDMVIRRTQASIFNGPDGTFSAKILWDAPAKTIKAKTEKKKEEEKRIGAPPDGYPKKPVRPKKRLDKATFLGMAKTMLGPKTTKKKIMEGFGISSPTLQKILRGDTDIPPNSSAKIVNAWNEWVASETGTENRILPPGTEVTLSKFTEMAKEMLGDERRPKDIIETFGISAATLKKISQTKVVGKNAGSKIVAAWNKWVSR